MDKSGYRRKIAEFDFLEPVTNEKRPASNCPAQIYRIKSGL
jgi:8-oxo-dGTP diphosphatase